MAADLEQLEAERRRLYGELSRLGDLRRGSIAVNFRRCGKENCACARPNHRGHGPQYLLMTKSRGHTRARTFRPGPALEKLEGEIANHRRFRELVEQIVAISDAICELRPSEVPAGGARPSSSGAVRIARPPEAPRAAARRSSTAAVRIARPAS